MQMRVAEAMMGVISLENLLVIATYFGKLPHHVVVIEVEAADDTWEEGLTPVVEAALPQVMAAMRQHAA
jgi:hypothetical protein